MPCYRLIGPPASAELERLQIIGGSAMRLVDVLAHYFDSPDPLFYSCEDVYPEVYLDYVHFVGILTKLDLGCRALCSRILFSYNELLPRVFQIPDDIEPFYISLGNPVYYTGPALLTENCFLQILGNVILHVTKFLGAFKLYPDPIFALRSIGQPDSAIFTDDLYHLVMATIKALNSLTAWVIEKYEYNTGREWCVPLELWDSFSRLWLPEPPWT